MPSSPTADVYAAKRAGPSTDPCGTPDMMNTVDNDYGSTLTFSLLSPMQVVMTVMPVSAKELMVFYYSAMLLLLLQYR